MSDERAPRTQAFQDRMDEPATREELFQVLQFTHLALLSQSLVNAAIVDGDRELIIKHTERSLDQATELLRLQRTLFRRWLGNDDI